MLKLRIKCRWFESNYSNNTCKSRENVAAVVQALREKETQGTKPVFAPRSVQNPVSLPLISFVKYSAPVTDFMAYQDQTGRTHPLIVGGLYYG
jgi:hypothetical protein